MEIVDILIEYAVLRTDSFKKGGDVVTLIINNCMSMLSRAETEHVDIIVYDSVIVYSCCY